MKGNGVRGEEAQSPYSVSGSQGFSFETRHGEASQSRPTMEDKVNCGKNGNEQWGCCTLSLANLRTAAKMRTRSIKSL